MCSPAWLNTPSVSLAPARRPVISETSALNMAQSLLDRSGFGCGDRQGSIRRPRAARSVPHLGATEGIFAPFEPLNRGSQPALHGLFKARPVPRVGERLDRVAGIVQRDEVARQIRALLFLRHRP